MNKPPLICFHHSGKYLYSEKYEHLKNIDLEILDEPALKVFQIDYEFGQKNLEKKISLYPTPGFQVYIPKDYELLNDEELKVKIENSLFEKKSNFLPLVDKKTYEEHLQSILEKIAWGYFYQVNYTLPFKAEFKGETLGIFKEYHQNIRGDFHAHLPGEDFSLISLSPELFLKKEKDSLLTRPIKGTNKAKEPLLKSEKESAELSMIVDLLRNDLNTLADKRSAEVLKHREILDLGHLFHTYSEITAQSSLPLSQILKKMLPGGSISGCPKQEACITLNHLEPFKRHAYTGIIGITEGQNALMSIAIRTFIATAQGELFYHSGGGIVFDSNIQEEYEELLLKASRI